VGWTPDPSWGPPPPGWNFFPKDARPWPKRHPLATTVAVVVVAVVIVSGIASAAGGSKKKNTADTWTTAPSTPSTSAPATSSAPTTSGGGSSTPTPKAKKTPHYTLSQKEAIESAEQYLQTEPGFSRLGLISQLDSKYGEGFSKKDANFAVNHIKVNWDRQAVDSAKGYLKTQPFSRDGLISQLDSKYGGQFTLAQATYAVNKVG
jgi:Host cell surface-exposed lipoprotein